MMLYFKPINRAMEHLNDAQFGELMKAVIQYAQDEPNVKCDDSVAQLAFDMLKDQIDADAMHYEEIVEKRRHAGQKGGQANARRNQANASFAQANESKTKQMEANAIFAIANQANGKQNKPNTNTNPNTDTIPDTNEQQQQETRARVDEDWVELVRVYEQNIGLMPTAQYEVEELVGLHEALGTAVMKEAIRATALMHVDNPHVYMRRICQKWMQNGITTVEQAKAAILNFQNKKTGGEQHGTGGAVASRPTLSGITEL